MYVNILPSLKSFIVFHYVSISTPLVYKSLLHGMLYIPLCIYFNPAVPALDAAADAPLHSTMSLFQPFPINCVANPTISFTFHYVSISTLRRCKMSYINKNIYIPLCIYFNFFTVTCLTTLSAIYIPLCIYFNSLAD